MTPEEEVIKQKINQLDINAEEITHGLGNMDCGKDELDLQDALEDLGNALTAYQEAKGYL
jgi:hypothetical protein